MLIIIFCIFVAILILSIFTFKKVKCSRKGNNLKVIDPNIPNSSTNQFQISYTNGKNIITLNDPANTSLEFKQTAGLINDWIKNHALGSSVTVSTIAPSCPGAVFILIKWDSGSNRLMGFGVGPETNGTSAILQYKNSPTGIVWLPYIYTSQVVYMY